MKRRYAAVQLECVRCHGPRRISSTRPEWHQNICDACSVELDQIEKDHQDGEYDYLFGKVD